MKGFYRSKYTTPSGEVRYAAVTQFEVWYSLKYELPRLAVKGPPANAGDAKRCWFNPWVEKIPWRRKWPPAAIFSSGEPHGQRSPVGYGQWGCKELDTTDAT